MRACKVSRFSLVQVSISDLDSVSISVTVLSLVRLMLTLTSCDLIEDSIEPAFPSFGNNLYRMQSK